MKTYVLKKDLPGVPAGTVGKISPVTKGWYFGDGVTGVFFDECVPQIHPDWFAEVDARWRPEPGKIYHCIADDGGILCAGFTSRLDEARFDFGNCFRTREEAEAASLEVKALLLEIQKRRVER